MSNIANTNTNTADVAIVEGYTATVAGANSTERKLSIVYTATAAATMALTGAGGRVGRAAIHLTAKDGLDRVAHHASHADYRPVAEYFAGQLGETFVVRRRADFESLPSQMEARIYKAKQAKNGGMRECKKTGVLIPGATLARLMRLHADAVNLVADANRLYAERMESQREAAALAAPARVTRTRKSKKAETVTAE